MYRLLIAGGDMRYVHLAGCFNPEKYEISVCGFSNDLTFGTHVKRKTDLKSAAAGADVIILPLPASYDKITINTPLSDECLYIRDITANTKALICLGKYDTGEFRECGISAIDYSTREDFARLNAVPTAEGAIFAAMNELDTTLSASKVLVCGFGRCAMILALKLKALDCKVCIAARSLRDLSLAQSMGFETANLNSLKDIISGFDTVFNSIPHIIFTEEIFKKIKPSCPIIDIASAPGGVDKTALHNYAVKYLFLPGLPGKYSPKTAAEIIYKTLINIISESSI